MSLLKAQAFAKLPAERPSEALALLKAQAEVFGRKIVVLDDDPTGVQTVHGVSVYTSFGEKALLEAFVEASPLFFLLTNSRGLPAAESQALHEQIARNLVRVSAQTGKDFLLISRSDSTLRGHYPMETEILRKTIENEGKKLFSGEVLLPYFKEGGRFTYGDTHYVLEGEMLVPAGETEFAKDKTFGYASSDLKAWVEEKTAGRFAAEGCVSVSLGELRALDIEGIANKLLKVEGFQKVIVNACADADVWAFCAALLRAFAAGKEFLLRTAAAVPKALGMIAEKPLLTRGEMRLPGERGGGLVVVGSHVQKTTAQLEALRQSTLPLYFFELDASLALSGGLMEQAMRIREGCASLIAKGESAVVYTSRQLVAPEGFNAEEKLRLSLQIADALTSIVAELPVRPGFLVAKGGITSSEIGVKALRVEKATVLGQILPGVPVWQTGEGSRFPGLPLVIFPGNVGAEDALLEALQALMGA
ncbi:MAG: hydroxyacid dehydrogenase [Christensenellaceae bacterium]|nr:hydroxyacid dehydrogenase [Christensenellaceae bacterium]